MNHACDSCGLRWETAGTTKGDCPFCGTAMAKPQKPARAGRPPGTKKRKPGGLGASGEMRINDRLRAAEMRARG